MTYNFKYSYIYNGKPYEHDISVSCKESNKGPFKTIESTIDWVKRKYKEYQIEVWDVKEQCNDTI